MRFLENRIFPTKTGSGCPGDFRDMSTHHKYSLLILLNDRLNKMSKIDQSGTKPETGQNLSGKFFSIKFIKFTCGFDDQFIFTIYKACIANLNLCIHQIMEKEMNKKAAVKISQIFFARSKRGAPLGG